MERPVAWRRPSEMIRYKPFLAVATVASLLVACGSSDSDDDAAGGDQVSQSDLDLDGRDFVSADVTVDGEPYPLADGTAIVLGFHDGGIQAHAGCNQMSGQGSYADGTLDVGQGLAMTEMACDPPERMDQDQWLAHILASKPTLALDGDALVLTAADTVINFTDKSVVEPDATLTATMWTLESIGTGGAQGAVSSVPVGVTSTLVISPDNELALAAGCNTGGARVEIADETMTVGPVRLTKMMCDEAANQVEQSVLAVLEGDVDYVVAGDQLTLTRADQTLTYRAEQ
jgi:heat shock protein HslJ